jgi:PleD family two-component response regulator
MRISPAVQSTRSVAIGDGMPEQNILVVEDERSIAEAVRFNLERHGYHVRVVHD